jgi:S1-C subfamily serine protease
MSFADAVARTAPAVVNIFTYRLVTEEVTPGKATDSAETATPALRQGLETGLGSGVIVDAAGHVVTNNHVIACAERIFVQLADGRIDEAQIVGTDPATDLAILQIKLKDLPAAVWPVRRPAHRRHRVGNWHAVWPVANGHQALSALASQLT